MLELDFCARAAGWANEIFQSDSASPFADARIEGRGSGDQRRKRKDLRFYDKNGKIAITGEVKLPGQGAISDPYNPELVRDAQAKADDADARYFFTWNVNKFVLWDRYQQDVPLLDRRVVEWPAGRTFCNADELDRPENLDFLKRQTLPEVLSRLGDIYAGRRADWEMAPDELFITSLESHLNWPFELTRAHLAREAERSTSFDARLQDWMAGQNWQFVRRPAELWGVALDRAARTIIYVLVNRLIFYQSLRKRFPELSGLRLSARARNGAEAYDSLRKLFEAAVRRTGDYEPLFYPHEKNDWAGPLAFAPAGAIEAWRAVLRGIESYDFSHISSDVVGRIFQRLIGPEERHRWGQHFTGDDAVDLINAFCIRAADDAVLDPACGSGSFLVRAYSRKRHLRPRKPHLEALAELFGCEIALYPAHLATLNLAAREINDEANYPRVARRDFFEVSPEQPFCTLPDGDRTTDIMLPPLAAVVGNPPYIRQEKLGRDGKLKMSQIVAKRWPELKLSGRSDAHCYFWPAAASFLREGGYFGFLTSSSWLDVEYGFALQRWILENFRIVAICESEAEPWFEDARVKTCATILRRCGDRSARMTAPVKFVQFKRPLAEIIGAPPDDAARFAALEALRRRIEETRADADGPDLRIIVKRQSELWDEGVRAGRLLAGADAPAPDDDGENGDGADAAGDDALTLGGASDYAGGKWGRYVRAPQFYFDVMREFGARFVPLAEIADIRRGITSGCDAFFMPRDITRAALEKFRTDAEFKKEYGVARAPVERGEIKIVRDGGGGEHPIEAEYLKPEVHSLMTIDRPVIRAVDLDRVVLMVGEPLSRLKGTWVERYLRYGEQQTFDSGKSKPVPQRSTCAARDPWYDLTKLVKPGFALWPKAQQYRHIISHNPEELICNCNLYDVSGKNLTETQIAALVGILNSTPVAFSKTYYGRFAGTEGDLKTEVIDVKLLPVPDPRGAPPAITARIREAFEGLCKRPIGRLVEEQLMDCHSPEQARAIANGPLRLADELLQPDRRALDDAVFELLGAADPHRRRELVDRLYAETAAHFRKLRAVEIQKQEQRSKSKTRRLTADDLAADIWDAATLPDRRPLAEWLAAEPEPKKTFVVPDGAAPRLMPASDMYERNVVYFGKGRSAEKTVCAGRGQAELLARVASLGLRGAVAIPADERSARDGLERLEARLARARTEFEGLAESRGGNEQTRGEVVGLLTHWFIHGRGRAAQSTRATRQSPSSTMLPPS